MVVNLCPSCFSECWHTRHANCSSSRQRKLSFSPCRVQRTSDLVDRVTLWLLSSKKFSHRFFNAKLIVCSSREEFVLQTGHSFSHVGFPVHRCSRQALQKLWLQDRMTGCLKMSRHTGQVSSFCCRVKQEAILCAIVALPPLECFLVLTVSHNFTEGILVEDTAGLELRNTRIIFFSTSESESNVLPHHRFEVVKECLRFPFCCFQKDKIKQGGLDRARRHQHTSNH